MLPNTSTLYTSQFVIFFLLVFLLTLFCYHLVNYFVKFFKYIFLYILHNNLLWLYAIKNYPVTHPISFYYFFVFHMNVKVIECIAILHQGANLKLSLGVKLLCFVNAVFNCYICQG